MLWRSHNTYLTVTPCELAPKLLTLGCCQGGLRARVSTHALVLRPEAFWLLNPSPKLNAVDGRKLESELRTCNVVTNVTT